MFVDKNNTVHVTARTFQQVLIWYNGSTTISRTITGVASDSLAVFKSDNGDIYVGNNRADAQVTKWTDDGTRRVVIANASDWSSGLFVDDLNNLYYSSMVDSQIMKYPLMSNANMSMVIAGNGSAGNAPNQLNAPQGITLDTRQNLYVADSNNNRVQLFRSGSLIGTTLAGNGASGTIALLVPIGLVFDAGEYLFIADCNNHRIIGSGPYGFRCIAGCSGSAGNDAHQLTFPFTLSFDTLGNFYVTDQLNSRIQKFSLATNSCGE